MSSRPRRTSTRATADQRPHGCGAEPAAARAVVRDGELLGYVQADADPRELRTALATRLPDYAVPTAIVCVDEFPLTVTGKLDERALPAPNTGRSQPGPMSATERRVHDTWCAVLGVPSPPDELAARRISRRATANGAARP